MKQRIKEAEQPAEGIIVYVRRRNADSVPMGPEAESIAHNATLKLYVDPDFDASSVPCSSGVPRRTVAEHEIQKLVRAKIPLPMACIF